VRGKGFFRNSLHLIVNRIVNLYIIHKYFIYRT